MSKFEREPRADKVEAVAELREILSAGTIILTDYQGLDVKGVSAIRKKLREVDSGYRIVKNSLFELAAKGSEAEKLTEGLVGPTAIAHTLEDPAAAAKALQEFTKGATPITVKAGVVDGQFLSAAQVTELSKIPGKQQLYAMVVGGLQSPITGLVGTLQQMIGQLVFTLQAVADQKTA
ncbi:MAG: 50S ribosomal protein L10 [Armatimonadetes bacterium]|nr:50S ribosomal protein L10 [Armatimonadota bacterium]